VLSGLAAACFVGALICSAVLVYCHAVGAPERVELSVRTGALVIPLVGAALRTIQGGLALDQEIERYSDYRGRTFQLRDRFNNSADAKERFHLMAELELAAVDQTRSQGWRWASTCSSHITQPRRFAQQLGNALRCRTRSGRHALGDASQGPSRFFLPTIPGLTTSSALTIAICFDMFSLTDASGQGQNQLAVAVFKPLPMSNCETA
jgi:hypothetical protein